MRNGTPIYEGDESPYGLMIVEGDDWEHYLEFQDFLSKLQNAEELSGKNAKTSPWGCKHQIMALWRAAGKWLGILFGKWLRDFIGRG